MSPFKARSKYRLTVLIELSFVRNTEATERSLLRNRARHGCTSLYEQTAGSDEEQLCSARGGGVRIKRTTAAAVRGVSRDSAVHAVSVILAMAGLDCPGIDVSILEDYRVMVHCGAIVRGRKFDSTQTPKRSVNSRSFQNSFCRVRSRAVVSMHLLPDGSLQGYPKNRAHAAAANDIVNGCVYAQVECFVHVETGSPGAARLQAQAESTAGVDAGVGGATVNCAQADVKRSMGVWAVVQVLQGARQEVFSGCTTVVTDEPRLGLPSDELYLCDIEEFESQLLLLKGNDDIHQLRFVECPGKLHLL